MASLVSGRPITLFSVFLTVLVLALGNPSTTSATKPADWSIIGDWRLVIDTNSCPYGWEDKAFCGPVLLIRVPPNVPQSRDRSVKAFGKLTGPNGPVSLKYDFTLVSAKGSSAVDPGYWQSSAQSGTPTGLPYGTYTYEWTYEVQGEWTCSKYFSSGCIWLNDSKLIQRYTFEWNGVNTFVYPVVAKTSPTSIPSASVSSTSIPSASVSSTSIPSASVVDYRNCTQLRKAYPNGIAKSKKAAAKQKQAPMVSPALYKAHIKLDRDKDGTICEK